MVWVGGRVQDEVGKLNSAEFCSCAKKFMHRWLGPRVLGGVCGYVGKSDSECEFAPQHLEFEIGPTVDGDSQSSLVFTRETNRSHHHSEFRKAIHEHSPSYIATYPGIPDQENLYLHHTKSPSSTYSRLTDIGFNMADRRRINGPVGTTIPPIYDDIPEQKFQVAKITRSRPANVIRKMCKHIEDMLFLLNAI